MSLISGKRRDRAKHGFSLVELVVVVVIIGILAAIAIGRFGTAAAQHKYVDIQRFVRDVKSRIDQENAIEGGYPTFVNLNSWFKNYKEVRTPFKGYGTGSVFVTELGNTHPGTKTLSGGQIPYWYNNANGAFRIRIPPQGSAVRNLELYNKLNQSRLSNLSQTLD